MGQRREKDDVVGVELPITAWSGDKNLKAS